VKFESVENSGLPLRITVVLLTVKMLATMIESSQRIAVIVFSTAAQAFAEFNRAKVAAGPR
jgi:hypothetical protein